MAETTASNVTNLGRDLLFILLWIGAWGSMELIIQWLSANLRVQLVLYMCLFISGFVSLIFVNPPDPNGKAGHTTPHVSPQVSAL